MLVMNTEALTELQESKLKQLVQFSLIILCITVAFKLSHTKYCNSLPRSDTFKKNNFSKPGNTNIIYFYFLFCHR